MCLVLAGLPIAVYLWLLRGVGLPQRQARWTLWAALGWGAVGSGALAIATTFILDHALVGTLPDRELGMVETAFIAPLAEELAKGVLVIVLTMRGRVSTALGGLRYGVACGLGFALTENFAYSIFAWASGPTSSWFAIVLLRTLFSTVVHATATGFWGAAHAHGRLHKNLSVRRWLPALGLVGAFAIHSGWNLSLVVRDVSGDELLMTAGLTGVVVAAMIALVVSWLAARAESAIIRQELLAEVAERTLPKEHAWTLGSPMRRLRTAAWLPSGMDGPAYVRTALELVDARLHRRLDPAYDILIARLRDRMRDLLLNGRLSNP